MTVVANPPDPQPKENAMSTLEDVTDAVCLLDPELDTEDEGFKIAVVLLAALQVGAFVGPIAEFTGFDPRWVVHIASRMEASGIWKDGVTYCNWFDDDGGGVEFWIHVAVAQGLLEVAS